MSSSEQRGKPMSVILGMGDGTLPAPGMLGTYSNCSLNSISEVQGEDSKYVETLGTT